MAFHYQNPGINPSLWGQTNGYNHALSPTLHNRKSPLGKGLTIKKPTLPKHCWDYPAPWLGYPLPIPICGVAVDANEQMTGALGYAPACVFIPPHPSPITEIGDGKLGQDAGKLLFDSPCSEKSLSPLIPVGGGMDTNDCCINF